ncbi:MAG: hypothetical protein HON51_03475 [Gammaproteobacteria bacterium]|mgnify:FL=1|jgi:transposase|nr:hypothetical protein [Gammaproteobacteria bacterium]MBT5221729.1 hypothetical protein [Gammaproteobacteria bacterium]MBT5826431.1 hypothetical protein [Gammaproteobacteria bacterium]MBT5966408.1 hypothetical protein [Gammaproteobacteria bacterium]MBT6420219.1 hypothetical protein [Gammaproteobacteria bacterium]
MDLSPAFIAGAAVYFPVAEITFDRFHVAKSLNKDMDKVRKDERKEHEVLKGLKYTVPKNRENLSVKIRSITSRSDFTRLGVIFF